MKRPSAQLRALLKRKKIIAAPCAYDALTARLIKRVGFDAVYSGGFITGGATCITEPLLTMSEQIGHAAGIANAVDIPLIMDAGAGWGEPLHTMRSVRECIRNGIAGVHIEDQLYPKRAHYHAHVAHNIPRDEYRDKIRLACEQRSLLDKDFVIIARSDACRIQGYKEAIKRINLAAEQGADLALIFPRNHKEALNAPKDSDLPLLYVLSRANSDGRPLYGYRQLADMGYKVIIDNVLTMFVNFHFTRKMLQELHHTGVYTGMTDAEIVAARNGVQDLVGLEDYYKIERATVEKVYYRKKTRR